jgi:hypothetical protein
MSDHREILCDWLRANGINPDEVPLDADLTIEADATGQRWIRCETYCTTNDGQRFVNAEGTDAARELVLAPLKTEPPTWWQPHTRPSREQLLEAIAAVHALHVRNPNCGDCEHCSERDYPDYAVPWPCPTMQALGDLQPEVTP